MGLRACRGARKLVSCSVLRTKWAPSMRRVCPQADRRCQCICGPVPGSRLHPVEELMLPRGWDGAGEEEPAHSAAAAAAKSLQSCPTLCDPIDGSPPGSPVPGILQARTLEWVAISFSNAGK